MGVEWGRLRILDAVARTGSVTHAAAMLHMTGPAVSQQLRRIEAEAGVRVVAPEGRGVRLTAQGRLLAECAHRVAALMQQAENDLHRSEERVGRIRIAAIASLVRTLLSERLPSFRREHPRVRVSIEDGETNDHVRGLAEGTLDLVLAESWSTAPLPLPAGISAQVLTRQPTYVVVAARHPLAARHRIGLQDVAEEPWTTCAQGSDAHTALTQAARRHGLELDVRYHVADHVTQLELVRAGLAVACLPASAEVRDCPGVAHLPLEPGMHRDVLLLSGDRPAPLALDELAGHLAG